MTLPTPTRLVRAWTTQTFTSTNLDKHQSEDLELQDITPKPSLDLPRPHIHRRQDSSTSSISVAGPAPDCREERRRKSLQVWQEYW
jgi:hypothetical protein